ncbi:MAG: hypothetical protein LBS11_00665 [Oscillospiraceae bacterium]|jgi:hypothetical protein|nr:hypothetical protein [Oscillospiraceae bacterium]
MKERQYAGGAVALGSLFLLLMRLLSPWFAARFDWIALVLTAIAAAGALLPVFIQPKPSRPTVNADANPALDESAQALRNGAAQLGWSTPEGGVYDALIKLSRRNAAAALAGAYATLTLLLSSGEQSKAEGDYEPAAAIRSLVRRKRMREPEAELLSSLIDTLDDRCGQGAPPIDQPSRDALLDAALSSIAFLERIS